MTKHREILIAPLDWGLGHATRCIPLIKAMEQQGEAPILASSGRTYELLQKEFPALSIIKLPSYGIKYYGKNMFLNIGLQLPKILLTVIREYKLIQKIVDTHKIELIISDNRFGCFSKKTRNIFITHQLNIKLPGTFAAGLIHRLVKRANHFFISKFDECWIPDIATGDNLSGSLSHPAPIAKVKYIGFLSRMKAIACEKLYDITVVLSGPEPQRSILEKKLTEQLFSMRKRVLIVQGKTEEEARYFLNKDIEIVSHLTGEALNKTMAASDLIICRSGYSTLMDLAALGRKALLIPTPGQTEQEYLAEYLFDKKLCYYQKQEKLDLPKAFEEINNFLGFDPNYFKKNEAVANLPDGIFRN